MAAKRHRSFFMLAVLSLGYQTHAKPADNEVLTMMSVEMLGSSATNPSLKDNASSPNQTSGGVMTSGNVPHCGHWDEHIERTVESCSFWLEGVLLTATGVFGLIGNCLSIMILCQPDMKNSFNQLLIALSTMDCVFIVLAIMDYSMMRAFKFSNAILIYMFPYLTLPLNNISFCGSIFTTVALAYERYCAVCKPLNYRNATTRYSVRTRTLCYIVPVLFLSVALNIPKFFEAKLIWNTGGGDPFNVTVVNATSCDGDIDLDCRVDFDVTDLRNDSNYIRFYINWTTLLTTGLIPMAALVYFNFSIFRGIQMTHERTRKRNTQRASEMNLAVILVWIVIMFIVCHLPRIVLNIHEVFMLDESMRECEDEHGGFVPPQWFLCMTSFNNWILVVNASSNFLIYCSVGTKFKTAIVALGSAVSKAFACKPDAVDTTTDTPTCANGAMTGSRSTLQEDNKEVCQALTGDSCQHPDGGDGAVQEEQMCMASLPDAAAAKAAAAETSTLKVNIQVEYIQDSSVTINTTVASESTCAGDNETSINHI